MCDAAERSDLAAVRSLVENQGRDVNEKSEVRYLTAAVATSLYLHLISTLGTSVNVSAWIHPFDTCCNEWSFTNC